MRESFYLYTYGDATEILTDQLHDHLLLSKYLYESLAQGRGILGHSDQQSPDYYLRHQYRYFMAGINPCSHLSFVDHLYCYLRLLFVLIIMHDHLEYPHRSQVSIPLLLDANYYSNN